MPKYRSTNDETRVYPTLSLTIEPGEVVELDQAVEAAGLTLETAKAAKAAAADAPASEESI